MQDGMMMGGPMMVMMFLIMLVVLVALIAGVVWLVRTLARGDSGGSHPRSAVEQLDLRYARGEIDRDDYIRRRDDLERE